MVCSRVSFSVVDGRSLHYHSYATEWSEVFVPSDFQGNNHIFTVEPCKKKTTKPITTSSTQWTQWTLHQIKRLRATDEDTLTSANAKCCRSAFPVGVCYSSIITCLQFVLGPKSGQRREKKEEKHTYTHTLTHTHLTARDYGCSYSSSHCGSTTGRVWGGRQACTLPDEEWTRLVEGQVPCGRGCAGTQMGTPGKLGGPHERPRASHPYLCCECCSWTGSGTCSKQIQATGKSTEGGQHMAANPGKEKARFPFTHKRGLITKSAQALLQNVRGKKKDWEMCPLPQLCISVNSSL